MGPFSVGGRVVNGGYSCCDHRIEQVFVVEGGTDHGSKGRMGYRHEPAIEATALDALKTLVSCTLGCGAGLPGEG